MDPGFFWSWERFEDRWTNYFGFSEEDLVINHVDVMENYNSLVCSNLKEGFMKDEKFIKVCAVCERKVVQTVFLSRHCCLLYLVT